MIEVEVETWVSGTEAVHPRVDQSHAYTVNTGLLRVVLVPSWWRSDSELE
jgi:hypothetical protein